MATQKKRTKKRGHRRTTKPVSKRTGDRLGKTGKKAKRARRLSKLRDAKLQLGLRILHAEKDFNKAAKGAQLSPEQLRVYGIKKGVVEKRGKKLLIKKDLTRRLLIFSGGRERTIVTGKSTTASLVGRYMAGVRWFVQTNDLNHLAPFVDKSVKDRAGKSYLLETNPNVLHRLASSGGSSFEQVYRIVV